MLDDLDYLYKSDTARKLMFYYQVRRHYWYYVYRIIGLFHGVSMLKLTVSLWRAPLSCPQVATVDSQ